MNDKDLNSLSRNTISLDGIPTRGREASLTADDFNKLLGWLNQDRDEAGRIYEEIRAKLIKGFKSHSCNVSEELADETINRVTRKLPEIIETYVGDPRRYFFGVAYRVMLEYQRYGHMLVPLPEKELPFEERRDVENVELVSGCLEKCLRHLAPHSRELILQFYQGEKQVKIKQRKELAERLNTKLANLRLQAHRIRSGLRKCILTCLEENSAG
jgi:DNA-directed RNA polymerase specialized sigma24 family protein